MIKKITIDELARMSQNEFSEIRGGMKTGFERVSSDLKGEISGFRSELKDDISGLRSELKDDILGFRSELNKKIEAVQNDLSEFKRQSLTAQDEMLTILRKLDDETTATSSIILRHEKQIARIEEKIGIAS